VRRPREIFKQCLEFHEKRRFYVEQLYPQKSRLLGVTLRAGHNPPVCQNDWALRWCALILLIFSSGCCAIASATLVWSCWVMDGCVCLALATFPGVETRVFSNVCWLSLTCQWARSRHLLHVVCVWHLRRK
jgi:hypothetical protein